MTTDAGKLVSKNPMISLPNKMKLGIFALNAHGGTAISVAPTARAV